MIPAIIVFLVTINIINGINLTIGDNNNNNNNQRDSRIIQTNLKQNYPEFVDGEEVARLFIQDYRQTLPVVLLIDNTQESHSEAAVFMKNIKSLAPNSVSVNFMLMVFNHSGVSSVLETTSNDRERFQNLLAKKVEEPSAVLGERYQNESAALFGVLNAARLLSKNSGIIIFINRGINDETLAQHTLRALYQKSIKVYVIWGGRYPTPRGEEKILEELAINTGGLFIPSSARQLSEEWYHEFLENNIDSDVSILSTRRNLKGKIDLHVPIDSDVTSFHITVSPPSMSKMLLQRPQGDQIDALNEKQVAKYASGSFLKRDADSLEVHLNTTTASTRDVGIWRLFIQNVHDFYNLTIYAHTKSTTNAALIVDNSTDSLYQKGKRRHVKLGVTGDISLITNISLINEDGQPILNKVKFRLDKNWENHLSTTDSDDIETDRKKAASIDIEKIPDKPFYIVVNGKNSKGNDIRRLSYVSNPRKDSKFVIPSITIEVGLSSQLIAQPGSQPEIIFEVTNNGNSAVLVQFICRDTESILISMNPWFKWISPQQTTNVRVNLLSKPGSYRDRVTLIAKGPESVSKEVYVDSGNSQDFNDRTSPDLDHVFTSDCTDNLLKSCGSGSWSVEIKAKDEQSGLLQLTSSPRGIIFPHGFITGSKEELIGYYSESCCNPDLQITAIDRLQNRRSYNINAYKAALGPGSIAAIVLGILLFILLIAVIVWLIRKFCCNKESGSYDIPTYRGPTSSSRRF